MADRTIHDTGMSYRAQGETREHEWRLSHLPVLLDEADWRGIERGLAQRAELLDAVLRDLYGERRLFAEGFLPAGRDRRQRRVSAAPASAACLPGRCCASTLPISGVGRTAAGGCSATARRRLPAPATRWRTGSSCRAPFPRPTTAMNVERLAPFFGALRDGLRAAAQRSEPRIGLFTPGPYSETYFEQAYLARYLGFLLVEGDDLTVHDGRLHVRTIVRAEARRRHLAARRFRFRRSPRTERRLAPRRARPRPGDARRRRRDRQRAGLGRSREPGAARASCRSSAGACWATTSPLPNIATWWCGQPAERDIVLDDLDALSLRGAYRDTVPDFPGRTMVLGAELDAGERERLVAGIRARPIDYVGQEVVRLSTTPVWDEGASCRGPSCCASSRWRRRTAGASCPAASAASPRAPTSAPSRWARARRSADVWVLADGPVAPASLLPAGDDVADPPRRRATCRAVPPTTCSGSAATWSGPRPPCASCAALATSRSTARRSRCGDAHHRQARAPARRLGRGRQDVGARAGRGRRRGGGARRGARSARPSASCARRGRRRRACANACRPTPGSSSPPSTGQVATPSNGGARAELPERSRAGPAARSRRLSGLAQENMKRGPSWHFLDMGRRIERAISTCRLARAIRRRRCDRRRSRRDARSHRLADHLSLALSRRPRACAGARHGGARPEQSAFRRLPGRGPRTSISSRCRPCATTASSKRRSRLLLALGTRLATLEAKRSRCRPASCVPSRA